MAFSIEIKIPPADLEPLYDHVHHAQSLRYMEAARLAFLSHIGAPNEALIEEGIFPVITRIDVEYLRELKGDSVTVTCEEVMTKGKALYMKQRIINSKEKTCVEALVVSMFLSGETKRAVSIPAKVSQNIEEYA